MSYTEYFPHPALKSYIDAYWIVRVSDQDKPWTHRVLPDCCTDLIFHKGETALIGTMTTFKDTLQVPDSVSIGIRFKPGAISAFYSLNLNEVTDLAVPYQDKQLTEIINHGKDIQRKLDLYFLHKLDSKRSPLTALMNDIAGLKGQLSVADLLSRHAMSERKMERLFKMHTGVSVKAMIKLVRFTNALDLIKNNSAGLSLTHIALSAGFYDQAHLCNEIKSYTGLPPSQL